MSSSARRWHAAELGAVGLLAVAVSVAAGWAAAPARAECAPPGAARVVVEGRVISRDRSGDRLLVTVQGPPRAELVARPYPSSSNDGLALEVGATYRFRAMEQGGVLLIDECSETLLAAAPAGDGGGGGGRWWVWVAAGAGLAGAVLLVTRSRRR